MKRLEFTLAQCLSLVSPMQLMILDHLAATAVEQKAEARRTHRKFKKGWTEMVYTQRIKRASLVALHRLGLIEAAVTNFTGFGPLRISRHGIELLEEISGEVIYA